VPAKPILPFVPPNPIFIMPPVLQITNVSKNFGPLEVVKDLSFTADRGTCVGLLGPNGAGKTTLVRMLTAQYPYPKGSIRVFDLEVCRHPRETKAALGIVPQTANLDPDFDVEDNLTTYSRYFGIPKRIYQERVEQQLQFWGLAEKKKAKITELSGGMVRRLLIARGLLNHPGLLVMDEPTAGLDPQSRRMVWDKITDLKRQGITILLTTHYMEEAQRLCDQVVVLSQGVKVADDAPERLIRSVMGEEILEVDGEDPAWRVWKAHLDDGLDYFEYGAKSYVYCTGCRAETLARTAVDQKLRGFSARRPNLEDIYLKLTGRDLS
jgi:lipooligosaccharide transport system ATP-binding protein